MKKGEITKFGNYPQDGNRSISPIEWLVLDVKENESLLISRYGLDCRQYNREWVGITWEDSNLRTWLNNGFIKTGVFQICWHIECSTFTASSFRI